MFKDLSGLTPRQVLIEELGGLKPAQVVPFEEDPPRQRAVILPPVKGQAGARAATLNWLREHNLHCTRIVTRYVGSRRDRTPIVHVYGLEDDTLVDEMITMAGHRRFQIVVHREE